VGRRNVGALRASGRAEGGPYKGKKNPGTDLKVGHYKPKDKNGGGSKTCPALQEKKAAKSRRYRGEVQSKLPGQAEAEDGTIYLWAVSRGGGEGKGV
jgi:hypothetical protein